MANSPVGHSLTVQINPPQQTQTVASDMASGTVAHGSESLERAAREAGAQADSSRYHYTHAQADALSSFAAGGFAQGVNRLSRRYVTEPLYDSRNADALRSSLYDAGVSPDELDAIANGSMDPIEGVNRGLGSGRNGVGIPGMYSAGMWAEMGKRTMMTAAGNVAWHSVKSAMADDAELDAANLGIHVSKANMTGFMSYGSGRHGDDMSVDSDNMSYMGLLRYMNKSEFGSLSPGEASEVISGIAGSFAGNRGAGDDALPAMLRARMAGVGEGGSISYLNQGVAGGGGDNVSGQSLERMVGALQELGVSGARSGHLLERIADNTLQMSMSGIRTDAGSSADFATSVARTPGLEGLGGRAEDVGLTLQGGAAAVRSKLVGGFASTPEIAQWVALAKRGGSLEDMIAGVEESGGDRQSLLDDYQNNLPGGIGKLGMAAAGFTMQQSGSIMNISRSSSSSSMRTSGDAQFAETNQGQSVYDQKREITGRGIEKVDLVLSPEASAAVESLNSGLQQLSGTMRDLGGLLTRGAGFTGSAVRAASQHGNLPGR